MHRHPSDDEVAALPISAGRAELLEQIMSTPVREAAAPTTDPDRGVRRQRWLVPLAAAACVAAVATGVAFPLWSGGDERGAGVGADQTGDPGTAAAAPYVVLDAPGWRVDYLDAGENGQDEIRYVQAGLELDVHQRPASQYADYVADREDIVDPPAPGDPVQALGLDGQLWPYSARDHTVILEPAGATSVEVRGEGMDEAAFLDLLAQLRRVDRETFVGSLPSRFRPAPAEVQEVVDGIAAALGPARGLVPPGEPEPTFSAGLSDPYQRGAEISGAVACRWIAAYTQARSAGDDPAARDAVEAMATSRQWPVLQEMDAEGDYPEVVWEYADEMAAGQDVRGYRMGLGCE